MSQSPNQQIPNIKPTFNQPSYARNKQPKRKGDNKDNLWCDFCQRYRHTRETCWKINGRPIISQSHVMHHPHPSIASSSIHTVSGWLDLLFKALHQERKIRKEIIITRLPWKLTKRICEVIENKRISIKTFIKLTNYKD